MITSFVDDTTTFTHIMDDSPPAPPPARCCQRYRSAAVADALANQPPATAVTAFRCFVALFQIGLFLGTPLVLAATGSSSGPPVFGWYTIYLTYWAGWLQAIYFSIAAINDLALRRNKYLRVTQAWQRMLFTLVFPLGIMVALLYYSILYPSLLHEQSLGPVSEGFHFHTRSHLDHGLPTIFIAVEAFCVPHRYSRKLPELVQLLVFSLGYLMWNQVCHAVSGVWPYPFQADLDTPRKQALFYAMLNVVGVVVYFICRALMRAWWGNLQADALPVEAVELVEVDAEVDVDAGSVADDEEEEEEDDDDDDLDLV
eukprot:PLAT4728.1.p2 GENE.PLAT4728.1~~PLAT4728.1.p2  ORF type:complete len:313 (+),score=143.50 PLAT4728.1:715-1653(+)